MHTHEFHVHCEHAHLKFCARCQVAYCADCGAEFTAKPTFTWVYPDTYYMPTQTTARAVDATDYTLTSSAAHQHGETR